MKRHDIPDFKKATKNYIQSLSLKEKLKLGYE